MSLNSNAAERPAARACERNSLAKCEGCSVLPPGMAPNCQPCTSEQSAALSSPRSKRPMGLAMALLQVTPRPLSNDSGRPGLRGTGAMRSPLYCKGRLARTDLSSKTASCQSTGGPPALRSSTGISSLPTALPFLHAHNASANLAASACREGAVPECGWGMSARTAATWDRMLTKEAAAAPLPKSAMKCRAQASHFWVAVRAAEPSGRRITAIARGPLVDLLPDSRRTRAQSLPHWPAAAARPTSRACPSSHTKKSARLADAAALAAGSSALRAAAILSEARAWRHSLPFAEPCLQERNVSNNLAELRCLHKSK